MAGKITIAEPAAVGPQGTVPSALASQQAQAAGKSRADLGALAAAAEGAGKAPIDSTTYPVSQSPKAAPAGSSTGKSSGAQQQGSAASERFVPGALASQQAEAAGKARVDLGAMSAAAQGPMIQAPPSSPARPGEAAQVAAGSDAALTGSVQKGPDARAPATGPRGHSLLQAHIDNVVRAATTPLPAVPPPRPDPANADGVTPLGPTDGEPGGDGRRSTPARARPPPDTVAPLSLLP